MNGDTQDLWPSCFQLRCCWSFFKVLVKCLGQLPIDTNDTLFCYSHIDGMFLSVNHRWSPVLLSGCRFNGLVCEMMRAVCAGLLVCPQDFLTHARRLLIPHLKCNVSTNGMAWLVINMHDDREINIWSFWGMKTSCQCESVVSVISFCLSSDEQWRPPCYVTLWICGGSSSSEPSSGTGSWCRPDWISSTQPPMGIRAERWALPDPLRASVVPP